MFASNSDAMELVLDEMERKNVSPFIVGYDVNDGSMEALKAGKIDGLVVQNRSVWGMRQRLLLQEQR